LVQSGSTTEARGVRVRPGAMCFWTVEAAGCSLYLDTRCGGMGVLLKGRTLEAAEICAASFDDADGFEAQRSFYKILCTDPLLPGEPIYGANNWYHAYGHATEEDILRETEALAKLTEGLENRPWFVIDDCWQPHRRDGYIGGPWDKGNAGFPDMPALAEKIRAMNVRPGIWMRPLLLEDPDVPASWRLSRDASYLDPSVPEVLERVHTDVRRLSDWGYKLIKHDFSTQDIFGRWGFAMNHEWTESGWRFADETRTSAEIIVALYRCILDAAGDAMILGCNCIGHLGAGLMHMNRTGDDTSGRLWARTRKMGVNTLAFTIAQEGALYAIDADCVALTDAVDEELSLCWLDLVARSGTALFVSTPAAHLNDKLCDALRKAYAIASVPRAAARPLDWRYTTCPARWAFADGEKKYNWAEPCGIRF
ncbi:MAG: alpha-galactosidase, partial [Oscillospiraceae bacterium]|nr:alpha-galactosidase [Oscillospiraceae bacterium]